MKIKKQFSKPVKDVHPNITKTVTIIGLKALLCRVVAQKKYSEKVAIDQMFLRKAEEKIIRKALQIAIDYNWGC